MKICPEEQGDPLPRQRELTCSYIIIIKLSDHEHSPPLKKAVTFNLPFVTSKPPPQSTHP